MDSLRHRELIEAMLPTSGDWPASGLDATEAAELREAVANDPALAAELSRVQGWDAQLVAAMEDVPVPAGMSQRLLSAVRSTEPSTSEEQVVPAKRRESRVSRRVWGAGVVSVIATSLLIAFLLVPAPKTFVESATLIDEMRLELPQLDDAWQASLADAPRTEYRFDDVALAATPRRWRRLETSLDGQAIVYDISSPGRKRAFVVVMQAGQVESDMASFPSREPLSNTEGICLGAWQRNGLIYVLVVDGTPARFGSFVKELSTG